MADIELATAAQVAQARTDAAAWDAEMERRRRSELGAIRTVSYTDPQYSEVRLSFDYRRIGGTLTTGGEVGLGVGMVESALSAGTGEALLTRDFRRAQVFPGPTGLMSTDASEAILSAPFHAIANWGDSMTRDQGPIGVSIAQGIGRELGVTSYDRGVSGDTPYQIGWRFGALPVTIDLGGSGTLPASGQVPVTVEPQVGWSASSRAWPCIVHDTEGQPVLVTLRQTGASPSSVPTWTIEQRGPAAITHRIYSGTRIAHEESFEKAVVTAPTAIWMGRNDVNLERCEKALRAILSNLRDPQQRCIVRPIFNQISEPAGSEGYARVMEVNEMYADVAQAMFLDSRKYMINHGLEVAQIVPTAEDLQAIAEDRIPNSLMRDNTHLTGPGRDADSRLEAIDIRARNW